MLDYRFAPDLRPAIVRIAKVDIDKQFRRCKLLGMYIRSALSETITLLARQWWD